MTLIRYCNVMNLKKNFTFSLSSTTFSIFGIDCAKAEDQSKYKYYYNFHLFMTTSIWKLRLQENRLYLGIFQKVPNLARTNLNRIAISFYQYNFNRAQLLWYEWRAVSLGQVISRTVSFFEYYREKIYL